MKSALQWIAIFALLWFWAIMSVFGLFVTCYCIAVLIFAPGLTQGIRVPWIIGSLVLAGATYFAYNMYLVIKDDPQYKISN